MNITLTIEAPELVGAIESLALALGGTGLTLPVAVPVDRISAEGTAMAEAKAADVKAKKEAAALEAELKAAEAEAKKAAASAKAEKAKKAAELAATEKANAEKALAEEQGGEKEEAPGISLEFVRGKLAEHAAQGKPQQVEVRDALSRFGVKKLTEVKPEDYADLLEIIGLSE